MSYANLTQPGVRNFAQDLTKTKAELVQLAYDIADYPRSYRRGPFKSELEAKADTVTVLKKMKGALIREERLLEEDEDEL